MNEYIDIILKICLLIIIGGVCGAAGYFLDFCFQEGNIFQSYLPWLAKRLLKRFKPAEHTEVMLLPKGSDRDNEFIRRSLDIALYKMLGGCPPCFNVYLSMATFTALHFALGVSWWYLPCLTFSAHIALRKLLEG